MIRSLKVTTRRINPTWKEHKDIGDIYLKEVKEPLKCLRIDDSFKGC